MTSEILPGSAVELYAIKNGERRSIPHVGGDITIDTESGEIEFTIYLADGLSGLSGAFLIDENGELTHPGGYDRFEIEVYHGLDDDEPVVLYYAEPVTVLSSEMSFPVESKPAQVSLQLTARDSHGFEYP